MTVVRHVRRFRIARDYRTRFAGIARAVVRCAVIGSAVIACSSTEGDAARDTTLPVTAGISATGDTTNNAPADTGCVLAGSWTECNLLHRLESAGVAPRRAQGAIRQPFLTAPGFVVAMGSAELQAYLYSDTLALQRDFERLDTLRVAPPTMQISWRATPTLIRSNNLIAILLSNDETQVERVRNAITAGLPAAPASP